MATKKITELDAIMGADNDDVLLIVDVSESTTYKITKSNFLKELTSAIGALESGKQNSLESGDNIIIEGARISAIDTKYNEVTTENAGLMSSADKIKLNNIQSGAEVNVQPNWNEVDTSSDSYIQNKPTIPDVSNFITKDVNDLTYYELKTNTGSLINLEINSSTYVVTLQLKNSDGTVISTGTIDLPLESVVVNGRYDNTTKKVILTLQNGNTVDFSVADLVAGLQSEITSNNKLASDLVDDTNSANKFVTTSEKNVWNNKEDKSNKVTTLSSNSTDTQYPSAKCVYDIIGNVETLLGGI